MRKTLSLVLAVLLLLVLLPAVKLQTAVADSTAEVTAGGEADGRIDGPCERRVGREGELILYRYSLGAAGKKIAVCSENPLRYGVVDGTAKSVRTEHENIAAIKEANSDISKIATTAALTAGKLDLYSGNDDQTLPILSLGGKGVISVLSNLLPTETSRMCHLWFEGDTAGATAMQLHYLPLIHALFSEVNPIPAKAAMSAMGFCENFLRTPLTPMEDDHKEKLFTLMRAEGLL